MPRFSRICVLILTTVAPWIAPSSAIAQSGPTILYFQSEECQPCRQLEPTLVELHQQGWDVRKIDAPKRLDVAKQFQVQNLPTLVVLRDGREADRIVGLVSKEQLHERLGRIAARAGQGLTSRSDPAQPTQPSGPIVRGQSPAAGAFPMLQANTALGMSVAPNAAPASGRPEMSQILERERIEDRGNAKLDAYPAKDPIARATDATVRIKVEEANTTAFGTGTIVATHEGEALILTCGHLFRDMVPGSHLKVDLFAGTPRELTVLGQVIDFKADNEDIGLVSIKLPEPIAPVAVLPHGETIHVGQAAFSLGCDHGNDPTRIETRITNVNRYLGPANLEIEGAPAVGRSGGGLFDAQGRLIGVCNAACNQDNEGIYATGDVIYQQLARVDQAHLFASATATEQPGQLVSVTSAPVETTAGPEMIFQEPKVELICVLRQADGSDRVVTISKPSQSLLEEIRQQGK